MSTLLFRQEVIDAGRDRLTGTVVAAVPPRSRLYTLLAVAVFAAVAAILMFGQYANSASVRGIVAYDAGIARVYPSSPAEIRQIHVRTGQRVNAGDPLVTLSLAQGSNGVASQIQQMANQDAELARQQALAGEIGSTEAQGLASQRSGLGAAIASLERQRSIAAGQIRLAEAQARRAGQLAAEGAGTQRQVEEARAALLARRAEVEALTERIVTQRETLRAIDNQIAERRLEASRSGAVIGAQRAALAEQREALLRTHQITLTAPIAGEVGDVSVEVGQRARPETSLVTVVPGGSRLEVWLYAPTRAVGFVRPGQEVRLLFDAFPYQTYGAGRGTVTQISRVPTEPSAIDAQLSIEEPVFRIRVAIDRLAPRAEEADRQLRPGMTITANLVQERRPLWEVFSNPFFRGVSR
jgi:membrane fusion protein